MALLAWPEADAVVPRTDTKVHPLCALYRRQPVRSLARRRLADGKLALMGLLEEVRVSYLEGSDLRAVDPDGLALFNVNTPDEFEQLRKRLRDRAH
jgi:molybdopterin-guanine dinucleotide biosynthesis protein A